MLSLHRGSGGRHLLRVTKTGKDAGVLEHPIDAQTAKLFEELWKALTDRVEPAPGGAVSMDGTGYQFWNRSGAGTVSNPKNGSILERATFAAEWLSRMVETPKPYDVQDLPYVRAEMRDALARVRQKEPCVRPYQG